MRLLDSPDKLKKALEARVPKEREPDRFSPDSLQAQEAATAWADEDLELGKALEPYGLDGWKKLLAALKAISPDFVGSLP